MSGNHLKQRVLTHLAEQGVPDTDDPWQAFQRGLLTAKDDRAAQRYTSSSQRSRLKPRASLHRPALALLFVLLVGVILLIGARDRAWAYNLLRFFALAPNDLAVEHQTEPAGLPDPAILVTVQSNPLGPTQSVPADPAACSSQFNPKCSLQQAQTLVDFPLMQFQALPDGIYFTGAAVESGRVTAMYGCSQGCLLWLEQTKAGSLPAAPAGVGSSAQVETVEWGEIQGEYVAGSYYGDDGSWNSEAGVSTLRWQQGDVVYTISAVQTEISPGAAFIAGKESFIQLASSLAADLSQGQPLNPLYLASIADARALAGFNIVEPGSLPEGYQFSFATYDAKTWFVCLHYAYNGASYPSLFIRQSPTAALAELKGYPGSNLHVAPVALAGADESAKLITGFASPEGACDADHNIFRAGQALLWQANGMSYEIYAEFPSPYTDAGLEQNELVRLGEDLMVKP